MPVFATIGDSIIVKLAVKHGAVNGNREIDTMYKEINVASGQMSAKISQSNIAISQIKITHLP